jgi:hypothetical protein
MNKFPVAVEVAVVEVVDGVTKTPVLGSYLVVS